MGEVKGTGSEKLLEEALRQVGFSKEDAESMAGKAKNPTAGTVQQADKLGQELAKLREQSSK